MEELMTVPEIADYLRVGKAAVLRYCREGYLPAVKVGKAYRFRRSDLEAWYEGKLPTAQA